MKSQFKYCPMCKGDMKFQMPEHDDVERNTCQECGYVDYNNAKPTVNALIINEQNEILLVRRAWHPFKGRLDVPGGFLEGSEHPEEGCVREAKEELGVDIELDGLFLIATDVYTDGTDEAAKNVSGHGVPVLSIFYFAHIISGEVAPTDEIAGYEWFPISELSGMIDQIAFPSNQYALKKLCEARS